MAEDGHAQKLAQEALEVPAPRVDEIRAARVKQEAFGRQLGSFQVAVELAQFALQDVELGMLTSNAPTCT